MLSISFFAGSAGTADARPKFPFALPLRAR